MVINYYVVSHFEWQPLPKFTKMATMVLLFKIETCNKKQHH